MKKRSIIVATILSLTMVGTLNLYLSNTTTASAKTTNAQSAYKPQAFQKVNLTSKSYLEIDDIQFYHVKNEKYVYYTVTVHNKDSKSLNLLDYWFKINSNTGEKYNVQLMGITDKKDNNIQANTSKTFKIYTKVNSKLNYYNLSLSVIKWDFTVPGFERVIGKINTPSSYNNSTPIGKSRIIGTNQDLVTTASALQLVEVGNVTESKLDLYVENKGDSTISLDQYKYYLRTNKNQYYTFEMIDGINKLLPGEKRKISLYTKLPQNSLKASYQLFISEETNTEQKVETPVAYYTLMIRDQKNALTGVDKEYLLNVSNQQVSTKVTNTMIDKTDEYNNVTITYELTNKGKASVKVPQYQYSALTDGSTLYPFQAETIEGELLPSETKEVTMTTSIPADKSVDHLKLIVKRAADEGKANDYLIAQYLIPDTKPVYSNNKATYINKQGSYEVTIENFERLPWDTQDIVNASIKIKNIGSKTQPMPKLAATTWFSGVKVESKDIHMLAVDESIGLEPGQTSEMILTTKVSSEATFKDARIKLSEVVNDKPVSTVGNFVVSEENAKLPTYLPGSTVYYQLNQPGIKAELNVLENNTYNGSTNNTLSTLLTYRNTGSRYSELPSIQAYYYVEGGVQIPAKVSVVEGEVGPDSAHLISITAEVPKRYNASDFKLLVGQGIAEGKYVTGKNKADGYVNAALLGLTEEQDKVKTLFEALELRPYTFKINKINAHRTFGQVRFDFEYNMSEYNPFDSILNKRKLVFELEFNGKKYSKAYELGEGNSNLSVGNNIKETIQVEDPNMEGIASAGFLLNVYEEVNGARKLLIQHDIYSYDAE